MAVEHEYEALPILRLQSDATTAFLRAARSGNLEKVIEYLDTELDINTSNSNGLNALHLASKDGHVEIVTELLKRGAKVDAATKKGNTALHIASLAGQSEIVTILIEYGAAVNIQSQNGFTPLYMAAQENHDQVVKILLSNGANQSLATEDGFTPLAVAMQQGHDKVVSVLLENDSKGKVRLPALHIAAKKDDCKAADLLLQNDHKPDVTSKSGFTPLHIAAHYGNEDIARLLIKRGADVNYLAKHNISPLHVAAKWGKNNMVKILLEHSAALDAKTRDGLTPLHCAARSGHEQCVTTLLENSAPISARTKNGLAPLHMASQGDHVDAARVLLYHRAPVDEVTIDYLTSLHVAAHCGHVRVAKLLLDRKADPNARALNGFTPLHIACKKNRIKLVELLLKHGASIESTTESGLTPLHVASFMGCMNIVIFLLQHEANPDVPTVRGETPLHLAARANQTDIIRILLRNGAKVDARAREQQTPLHIASRLGNVDIVMLLLQHGAAVDTTTKDMYTALHIAAKEGQEEVAAILVDNNASVTATTKNGFTPLHVAAKYGNMNVTKILLQKDSKLDAQGKNDVTPLLLACHYDHPNVAQLLLDKGASPHLPSQNGQTPLHIAARKNQMDIASTLLEHGARANVESKAGFTPLHLSAQKGHYDMTNLLIEHGADPNHKAKNGLTALHLCAQEDFIRVASILVKNGADVESETETGYRPIHVASHFGNLSMIRFLLKHNAAIDVDTKQNYTPLHQAAQQGHAHIVSALVEANASHRVRTNDGLTALNIAQKLGYISVMEVLKGLPYDGVTPDNKNWEEKYKVIAPESLQETSLMSDSDDEGGSDALISEQPYRYLTADLMKSLRDDSLPIDVTRDDPLHKQLSKEEQAQFIQSSNYCAAENFDSNDISRFLVSFLVDARGGTMKGCRHSGIRLIVPPRRAAMPIRVTCRLVKPSKMPNPPPLMEGESLATRVIEMGPVGASFLGPVLIDIPHFASVQGIEREIIILRSENGETWKEHDNSADNDDTLANTPYDPQMSTTHGGRITRIITTEFPQYFAVVTRIKQEVHVIGAEGGILISSVAPTVQAVFPPGALTKKIKVGLQAHVIPAELTAKLLGNCVAVSPVITIEPRRRKFHKPISLTLPVPQAANKGMINQYGGETPTLRLLCSIAGGTSDAQWEDVTGSTPLNFMNDKVSFTTTVSARFWLMDCRNIQEVPKMATDLYHESLYVPFITNFVIYSKRLEEVEATLRILCMTDSKEGIHTLEKQEEFAEIVKSRDVETLDGKDLYIEFSGNLVPVTKSGQQLKFTFKAFRQNRLSFHVKVKDPQLDPVARMMFMREPKVVKGEPAQQPVCVLNIVLPEIMVFEKKVIEDSNIISQKLDYLRSAYNKIDYSEEKGDYPKKFIADTLQKEQTDAAASLLDQESCYSKQDTSSPALEKKTYGEKKRFWEDIAHSKRESFQRSESEVSHTSQLTYHDSDSEGLSEVREEGGLGVDMSETTVAEKTHYFEEQIQRETRNSLKSQSSQESTRVAAARLSGISISSEDDRSFEAFEDKSRMGNVEVQDKKEEKKDVDKEKRLSKEEKDLVDKPISLKDDKRLGKEESSQRKSKDEKDLFGEQETVEEEKKDEKRKSKESKDFPGKKQDSKDGKSIRKSSKGEKDFLELKGKEIKDDKKKMPEKEQKVERQVESSGKNKLESDLLAKETVSKIEKVDSGDKIDLVGKTDQLSTKTARVEIDKESKPKATKMQENVTKQLKGIEPRSPILVAKTSKPKEETISKSPPKPVPIRRKSKEDALSKSPPKKDKSKEDTFSKSPPKKDKLKEDTLSKSPPKKDHLREDALSKSPPKKDLAKEVMMSKSLPKKDPVKEDMLSKSPPKKGSLKGDTQSKSPPKEGLLKEDLLSKSPPKKGQSKEETLSKSPPKKSLSREDIAKFSTKPDKSKIIPAKMPIKTAKDALPEKQLPKKDESKHDSQKTSPLKGNEQKDDLLSKSLPKSESESKIDLSKTSEKQDSKKQFSMKNTLQEKERDTSAASTAYPAGIASNAIEIKSNLTENLLQQNLPETFVSNKAKDVPEKNEDAKNISMVSTAGHEFEVKDLPKDDFSKSGILVSPKIEEKDKNQVVPPTGEIKKDISMPRPPLDGGLQVELTESKVSGSIQHSSEIELKGTSTIVAQEFEKIDTSSTSTTQNKILETNVSIIEKSNTKSELERMTEEHFIKSLRPDDKSKELPITVSKNEKFEVRKSTIPKRDKFKEEHSVQPSLTDDKSRELSSVAPKQITSKSELSNKLDDIKKLPTSVPEREKSKDEIPKSLIPKREKSKEEFSVKSPAQVTPTTVLKAEKSAVEISKSMIPKQEESKGEILIQSVPVGSSTIAPKRQKSKDEIPKSLIPKREKSKEEFSVKSPAQVTPTTVLKAEKSAVEISKSMIPKQEESKGEILIQSAPAESSSIAPKTEKSKDEIPKSLIPKREKSKEEFSIKSPPQVTPTTGLKTEESAVEVSKSMIPKQEESKGEFLIQSVPVGSSTIAPKREKSKDEIPKSLIPKREKSKEEFSIKSPPQVTPTTGLKTEKSAVEISKSMIPKQEESKDEILIQSVPAESSSIAPKTEKSKDEIPKSLIPKREKSKEEISVKSPPQVTPTTVLTSEKSSAEIPKSMIPKQENSKNEFSVRSLPTESPTIAPQREKSKDEIPKSLIPKREKSKEEFTLKSSPITSLSTVLKEETSTGEISSSMVSKQEKSKDEFSIQLISTESTTIKGAEKEKFSDEIPKSMVQEKAMSGGASLIESHKSKDNEKTLPIVSKEGIPTHTKPVELVGKSKDKVSKESPPKDQILKTQFSHDLAQATAIRLSGISLSSEDEKSLEDFEEIERIVEEKARLEMELESKLGKLETPEVEEQKLTHTSCEKTIGSISTATSRKSSSGEIPKSMIPRREKSKEEIPKSMIPQREKSKEEFTIRSKNTTPTVPKREKSIGEIPKSMIPRRENSKDEFSIKSPPMREKSSDEIPKSMIPRREKSKEEFSIKSTPKSASASEASALKREKSGEIPKSMIPKREKSKDEFSIKSPPMRERSSDEIPRSMIPRREKSKEEFSIKSPPMRERSSDEIPRSMIPRREKSKEEFSIKSPPMRERSSDEIPRSMIPKREKSKEEFSIKSPPKGQSTGVTTALEREKSGEIPKSMIPKREKSKEEFSIKSPPMRERSSDEIPRSMIPRRERSKEEFSIKSPPMRERSSDEIPRSMIPKREKSKEEFSIKSPPKGQSTGVTTALKREKSGEIPKSMIPKREKSKEEFSIKSPPMRERSSDEIPRSMIPRRETSKEEFSIKSPPKGPSTSETTALTREKSEEIPKSMIPKREKSKDDFSIKSPPKQETSKKEIPTTSAPKREKSKGEISKSTIPKREKSKEEFSAKPAPKREKSKDDIQKTVLAKREKSKEEISAKIAPRREKSKDEITAKPGVKRLDSKLEQTSKPTPKKTESTVKTLPKRESSKEEIPSKSVPKRRDSNEESPQLSAKKSIESSPKTISKREKSKEEIPKTPLAKRKDSKEEVSKSLMKRPGSSRDSDSRSSSIKSDSPSPKASDKFSKKDAPMKKEIETVAKKEKSGEVTTQQYVEHTRKQTSESKVFSGTFTGDPQDALKLLEDTSALKKADFITSDSVVTSQVEHKATTSLEKKEIKSSEMDTGREKIFAHEEKEDKVKKESSASLFKSDSPNEKVIQQESKVKEKSVCATQKTLVNLTDNLEIIQATASQIGKESEHGIIKKSVEDTEKIVTTEETSMASKESTVGVGVKLEKDLNDISMKKDDLGKIVEKSMFQEELGDSSKTFDEKRELKHRLDAGEQQDVNPLVQQKIQSPETGTIESEVYHDELADDLTRKFKNIMHQSVLGEPMDIGRDSSSVSISEDITRDESSSLQLSSSQAKLLERDITMSPSSISEQTGIEELDENMVNRQRVSDANIKEALSSLEGMNYTSKTTTEGKFISELSGARVLEILEPEIETQSRQDSMDVSSIEVDEIKTLPVSQDAIKKNEYLRESHAIDSLDTLERDFTMSTATFSEDTNIDFSLPRDSQKKESTELQKIPIRKKEKDSFEIDSPPLVSPRLKVKELEIKPVDWMIGDEKIEVSETLEPCEAFDKELEEYQSTVKMQQSQGGATETPGNKKFEIPRIEETSSMSFDESERIKPGEKLKFTVIPVSEQDLEIEKELVENKLDISCQELIDTLQREYDAKTPTGDSLEEMAAKSFHFMTVDEDEDSFDYDKEQYEDQKREQSATLSYDESSKFSEIPFETKTAVNVIEGEQFMRLEEHHKSTDTEGKSKDGGLVQLYEEQFEESVQLKDKTEELKKLTIEDKISFESGVNTGDMKKLESTKVSQELSETNKADSKTVGETVGKVVGSQEDQEKDEKRFYDIANYQQPSESSEMVLKMEVRTEADDVELLSYKTFDPEKLKKLEEHPVTAPQKPVRTETHREGKVDMRSKGWDDHKRSTEKRNKSHSHSETSPYKAKKEDLQSVDMSARYAITVLDQVVKKEIAEVKENLEAAKQDLIEELSENSENIIQIKDSPSEFQFKLQPESIPNELPFLYKAPSLDKASDTDSSSPVAKPRRHGEVTRESSSDSSSDKKTSDKEPSKTSVVVESESTTEKSSQIFESFSTSPKAASRSGSEEGTTKDEAFSLLPPQPAPRRRQKTNATSESEADISSSESNYQSCDYYSSGSRPCSSDVELLAAAASSTTASEYETAMMSFEHSSKEQHTSQDYHTAVSSLSSEQSMKSLNSISSGQMGGLDSASEISETIMASEAEMEQDEIDENLEDVLDDDSKDEEGAAAYVPDFKVPSMMKRSSEMIFTEVITQESFSEGKSIGTMRSSSSSATEKHPSTSSTSGSADYKTASICPPSMTQAISKQPSEEPSTSSSDPISHSKEESYSFEPDSLEVSKFATGPSAEDDTVESHVMGSGLTLQQQLSMTSSSMSGVSLETVIEKEQTDRQSPDSDSFELVDKPDLIDDFVVVEEVGREAEEFDCEGKGIHISSMSFTSSKQYDRDVENLIAAKEAQKPQAHSTRSTAELFEFDSEESPPQKSNEDQYSQSFSDEEQYSEGGKKWVEMQFQQSDRLYDIEYERGPLEDIKEEEIADFEGSRIGSVSSQKESIGSMGSMRGSFGSTPDNFDALTAKRYFKPTDHDNASLSSLQEFEHLENAVALENAKRREREREQQHSGSQDSSSNGSLPRRYVTGMSLPTDEVSASSVKDFEVLEKACKEAHLIELRAREEEDLLDHESPENRFKLENLARAKVESQGSAPGSFNPSTSGSDDYEKRIKEIDEIIRLAQSYAGKNDKHDDTTEDISQIDSSDTVAGKQAAVAPVTVVAAAAPKPHTAESPVTQVPGQSRGPSEANMMETSTDSLELETNGAKNYNFMCRSSDSLELKATLHEQPSLSSDSLNNIKDSKEEPEKPFSSNRRISSDSLEFAALESQDSSRGDDKDKRSSSEG